MSDLEPPFEAPPLRSTRATASLANLRGSTEGTVFVELGESSKKALIAHDGAAVPIVKTLPDRLNDLLAGSELIVQKVVSQSIAPGAVVPRGTAVDLVLTRPGKLPLKVFDGVHLAFIERPVDEVFDSFIRDDPDVRNVLARNDTFETLSDRDKTILTQRAQTRDIAITDQPGTDLASLFGTLQAANTFGG